MVEAEWLPCITLLGEEEHFTELKEEFGVVASEPEAFRTRFQL